MKVRREEGTIHGLQHFLHRDQQHTFLTCPADFVAGINLLGAGAARKALGDNGAVFAPWAVFGQIGGPEQGDGGDPQGDGDVHRSGVVRDKETGLTYQRHQLADGRDLIHD